MSSIQDIHAFAERIYDIVQDLICLGDSGQMEADNNKIIVDSVNSWMFLV
jgi:hypothetical protein